MTGKDIFYSALDLCSLRTGNGEPPQDTEDLAQRAVSLINILLAENAYIDARIRKEEHTVERISALEDEIAVSVIIAASVLPYGLARLFMIGEDDTFANSMNALYESARKEALRFGKATIGQITEVYE